jgi:chemotaxis protein MotA
MQVRWPAPNASTNLMSEEIPAQSAAKPKSSARPDVATLAGLVLAFAGILGGLLIEGGKIKDIAQFTAALIVLGGTVGAVMVSTPLAVLIGAARRLLGVFLDDTQPMEGLIEELIEYATKARKQGLVSLEQQALLIADPFLRKALNLAVDGTDLQEIRKMLELEIDLEQHHADEEAKVFENAGGYAPTIGIIGAVLGLIQVMKNLANIDGVGHGIAVSFVATVYGVGSANLFFLPAATKIKSRSHSQTQRKELILEGVCGIVEGLNPKLIRSKLEAYMPHGAEKKKKDASQPNNASEPAGAEG